MGAAKAQPSALDLAKFGLEQQRFQSEQAEQALRLKENSRKETEKQALMVGLGKLDPAAPDWSSKANELISKNPYGFDDDSLQSYYEGQQKLHTSSMQRRTAPGGKPLDAAGKVKATVEFQKQLHSLVGEQFSVSDWVHSTVEPIKSTWTKNEKGEVTPGLVSIKVNGVEVGQLPHVAYVNMKEHWDYIKPPKAQANSGIIDDGDLPKEVQQETPQEQVPQKKAPRKKVDTSIPLEERIQMFSSAMKSSMANIPSLNYEQLTAQ